MLKSLPAISCAALLALSAPAWGQPPPGGGAPGNLSPPSPGGFGGGPGWAGRLDDVKKQIGASDEEWKVIGPKLQKVLAARQAAEARGPGGGFDSPPAGPPPGGGFGGPGERPGGSFQGPGGFPPFGGGPGGVGGPPQPGQLLPPFLQDSLNLTAEQKEQVARLQKEVEDKLGKILTAEQKKQLREMGEGFGGGPPGGPARPPGGEGPGPGASAARGPMPGGAPPPGGPGGGAFGGAMGANAVSQAQADLKAALDDSKHSAADIQEKVAAVRKARHKARADLEAAQKDLLPLLTAEQEAVLVSLGYLD